MIARNAQLYALDDRERALFRAWEWEERTARGRDDVRLRQQRRRLKAAVQPQTPAAPGVDPWKLGAEAVEALMRVRRTLSRTSTLCADLDEAIELVKQLAHGPEV